MQMDEGSLHTLYKFLQLFCQSHPEDQHGLCLITQHDTQHDLVRPQILLILQLEAQSMD